MLIWQRNFQGALDQSHVASNHSAMTSSEENRWDPLCQFLIKLERGIRWPIYAITLCTWSHHSAASQVPLTVGDLKAARCVNFETKSRLKQGSWNIHAECMDPEFVSCWARQDGGTGFLKESLWIDGVRCQEEHSLTRRAWVRHAFDYSDGELKVTVLLELQAYSPNSPGKEDLEIL